MALFTRPLAGFKKKGTDRKIFSKAVGSILAIVLHPPFTKRQIFVGVTIILTALLLLTQTVSLELRYQFVVLLSVLTYILAAYALRDDLSGVEWFTLLVPISLFSSSIAVFYFLLPVRWLTRIPVALLYGVGMYALLLTNNIYNVAAIRTIALLRAGRSVGFILNLVSFYLLTLAILSQRWNPFSTAFTVGVLGYVLTIPALWCIELGPVVSRRVRRLSMVIATILTQAVWALSFLPVLVPMASLLYTAIYYSMVGIAQEYLDEKLYKKIVTEFVAVTVIVLSMVLLTMNWR
jgi:hypothetical protein